MNTVKVEIWNSEMEFRQSAFLMLERQKKTSFPLPVHILACIWI